MAFASPVKQMIFALKEMANYSDLVGSKLWPDLDDSFVETLLNVPAFENRSNISSIRFSLFSILFSAAGSNVGVAPTPKPPAIIPTALFVG